MKKLPWSSLALLLVTYSTFGWQLYAWTLSWRVWLMVAAFVLLMALALTAPSQIIRICFGGLLKSDTAAFITMIAGSFVGVVILRWFPFFAHFLLLVSASLLARFDIQLGDYSERQAFAMLAVVSLAGFGLGLLLQQLF